MKKYINKYWIVGLFFLLLATESSVKIWAMQSKRPRESSPEDLPPLKFAKSNYESLLDAIDREDEQAVASLLSSSNISAALGQFNITPLYASIAKGNASIVKAVLDFAEKNNRTLLIDKPEGPQIYSPLFMAASQGNFETTNLLLNYAQNNNIPVNLETKNTDNKITPLFIASLQGHTLVVNLLLKFADKSDQIIDINKQEGILSSSALFEATQEGYINTVKTLLEYAKKHNQKIDFNLIHGENNYTLLTVAALNNQAEMVKAFLEYGADPNTANNIPLLSEAIISQFNRKILEYLLEYGIKIPSNEEDNPTFDSALQMITDAPSQPAATDKLIDDIIRNDIDSFRISLNDTKKENANRPYTQRKVISALVNSQTTSGFTPLMWAVVRKHNNFVQELLNFTDNNNILVLNPHIQNNAGETALDLAYKHNNQDAVNLLYNYTQQSRELNEILLERKEIPREVSQNIINTFIYGEPANK